MSQRPKFQPRLKWLSLGLAGTILVVFSLSSLFAPASGAQLTNRKLQLDNNLASASAQYDLSFGVTTAGTLGSIQIQFCSNDALESDPCTAPAGFSASAAVLSNQTGATGFSISPASTANNIILTRAAAPVLAATAVEYDFTGVTNPSAPGSYFVRLLTFASTDASGNFSDYGGIAFNIANNVSVSAEVPPYLIFCTGVTITGLNCANAQGDYIDFGELSMTQARAGSSQMLAATNALNGYFITVNGTTLASGNNAIAAMALNDVSRPGTQQFGLNLVANAAPSDGSDPTGPGTAVPSANYATPNSYRFDTGDTVVSNSGPDNVRVFTDSYIVNVPVGQAPGIYVSTITYVCLATF